MQLFHLESIDDTYEKIMSLANCENVIFRHFLDKVVEEMAMSWGYGDGFVSGSLGREANGSVVLLEYRKRISRGVYQLYIINEDGQILKARTSTKKTGQTYTGDIYLNSFTTSYIDITEVGQIHNRLKYKNTEKINASIVETASAEIISELIDL